MLLCWLRDLVDHSGRALNIVGLATANARRLNVLRRWVRQNMPSNCFRRREKLLYLPFLTQVFHASWRETCRVIQQQFWMKECDIFGVTLTFLTYFQESGLPQPHDQRPWIGGRSTRFSQETKRKVENGARRTEVRSVRRRGLGMEKESARAPPPSSFLHRRQSNSHTQTHRQVA